MNDQNTNIMTDCTGGTCEGAGVKHKTQPAYHVAETDTGVTIDVALPGVRKEDVAVSSTGNVLTLSAQRQDSIPDDWKAHHVAPRPDAYELKVRLNRSLDPGRITATMADGVLRLTVSKREEAQPRRISVN